MQETPVGFYYVEELDIMNYLKNNLEVNASNCAVYRKEDKSFSPGVDLISVALGRTISSVW